MKSETRILIEAALIENGWKKKEESGIPTAMWFSNSGDCFVMFEEDYEGRETISFHSYRIDTKPDYVDGCSLDDERSTIQMPSGNIVLS